MIAAQSRSNYGATKSAWGVPLAVPQQTTRLVAVTGGWAPGLKIGPDAAHAGQSKIGAVSGTYVPLVDFN